MAARPSRIRWRRHKLRRPDIYTATIRKISQRQIEARLAIQESALDANDDAALTNETKVALELVDESENVFG